ncbi:MAG TPA: hypothetical protein VFY17_03245 [Pilimelia sp.]|nr:hypothetical protein [Pilimelia sp.]
MIPLRISSAGPALSPEVRIIDDWVRTEFTALNRAILSGATPAPALRARVAAAVLPALPAPADLDATAARQLVVLVGLVAAALARYRQEADSCPPEHSLSDLRLPAGGPDLPTYFTALADRTGVGHPPRDSYTSLVRWNVPRVAAHWRTAGGGPAGTAAMDGCFPDHLVRTYTGNAAEESFFVLIKQGEVLEQGANRLLAPLAAGDLRFGDPAAVARVHAATALLHTLRRLFGDYPRLPGGHAMTPAHFMDVFRQYAAHWRTGDLPPSGAFDTEAIVRDLRLGTLGPDGAAGIRRLYPGLLAHERVALDRLLDARPLTARLLDEVGVPADALPGLPPVALARLAAAHPALSAWYGLLSAHARVSSAHFGLARRMLFKPQEAREVSHRAGTPLVDNSRGTTGMTERYLLELTRRRQRHPLEALRTAVSTARPADADRPDPHTEVVVTVAGRSDYR